MNRVELTSINTLVKGLNTKKVYVLMIPCEITDRRTNTKVSDYLYEIVRSHEKTQIDVAVDNLKRKADNLGADIEVVDYENIEWSTVEISNDALFEAGEKYE